MINNYGPSLYRSLGFSEVKQLLYPAAWVTLALGVNVIAMYFVDRYPRNKYVAIGILGCEACLIVEAALVANFVPSDNQAALQAAVAMFFLFQFIYNMCLDGPQFSYLSEIWPTHLRAKGVSLGSAMIAFMNIIWLQSAPVAFETIGWKFYLVFIICGSICGLGIWFFSPDTNGLPLEEVAAIFGDADEVAIYQRDLEIDFATHTIKNAYTHIDVAVGDPKEDEVLHVESDE